MALDSNDTDVHTSTAVDKTSAKNAANFPKEPVKQPETEITKSDEISGEVNINNAANASIHLQPHLQVLQQQLKITQAAQVL